mgnify:CR=1 FL=1
MKGGVFLGILVIAVGIVALGYAAYKLNQFLFVEGMLEREHIPLYARDVGLPFILGILVLIDGSIILGMKRMASMILHVVANVAWIYGTFRAYTLVQMVETEIRAYQLPFLLYVIAVFLFIFGAVINAIPKKSQ